MPLREAFRRQNTGKLDGLRDTTRGHPAKRRTLHGAADRESQPSTKALPCGLHSLELRSDEHATRASGPTFPREPDAIPPACVACTYFPMLKSITKRVLRSVAGQVTKDLVDAYVTRGALDAVDRARGPEEFEAAAKAYRARLLVADTLQEFAIEQVDRAFEKADK